MWNLIFELLVILFAIVCFYRLAKVYGDKFKFALKNLDRMREGDYGFTANMLSFRMYRAASILFELVTYALIYLFFQDISKLLN